MRSRFMLICDFRIHICIKKLRYQYDGDFSICIIIVFFSFNFQESLTLVARGAIVPRDGVNVRVHRRHSI